MKINNSKEIRGDCGKKPSLKDSSNTFFTFAILLFLIFVGLDFLLKLIVETAKPDINIFGFFEIQYTTNTGVAFGILKNSPLLNMLLIVLVLIIFLFLFYKNSFDPPKKAIFTNKNASSFGFILVISGGIGNLIDRILYGYVIDFIKIGSWPNFNLADSYITVGVVLIMISLFLEEYNMNKKNKRALLNKTKT